MSKYIDADKIIPKIAEYLHIEAGIDVADEQDFEYYLNEAKEIIQECAVDIEQERHGEWIENDNNLVTYRLYELNNGESYCQEIIYPFFCSECRGGSEYKSRYCMDCGAKMDKE